MLVVPRETIYEKTMRLLMTADQNVVPMDEDMDEDEDIATDIVGQKSILDFFGRKRAEMMDEDLDL
mgnify:FL=1|jgi:hypothetical protein